MSQFAQPYGLLIKKKMKSSQGIGILIILMFSLIDLSAQIGGRHSFEFLNLTQSSRVTALGGTLISVIDNDITLGYANPALLNDAMHTEISFNHNFHFADISHGFAVGGYYHKKLKTTFQLGFNYVNYGNFTRADVLGNITGEFSSGESAITIGAGRELNERIRAGLNVKYINSSFDIYGASGVAADIGLNYHNPDSKLSIGLVARQIGTSLSNYTDQVASLPFDLQLGLSKRFKYLPFRFSVTAHHLHQWRIRLDEANQSDPISFLGVEATEQGQFSKGLDNLFRHFVFSGEFLIGQQEQFKLRLGYNHMRRKELSVSEFRSLGGLSFGIGFKISKFRLDYGLGYYHLAGAVNHLSFSLNLASFAKKI